MAVCEGDDRLAASSDAAKGIVVFAGGRRGTFAGHDSIYWLHFHRAVCGCSRANHIELCILLDNHMDIHVLRHLPGKDNQDNFVC